MSLCPRTFLGAFHHAVFISALWSWGCEGGGDHHFLVTGCETCPDLAFWRRAAQGLTPRAGPARLCPGSRLRLIPSSGVLDARSEHAPPSAHRSGKLFCCLLIPLKRHLPRRVARQG